MFEQAGHSVYSWRSLSPRLRRRADVIVWFPNDFNPPTEEVRLWLEDWLTDSPGRTLIYVGRDYDAEWRYWEKIETGAPAGQAAEITSRKWSARNSYSIDRNQAPKNEDCTWFTVKGKWKPRDVRTLQGEPEWLEGIDPARLEIELNGRFLPSDYADVLLESDGDVLVSVEPWLDSRAIVVTNGSFLLNLPLVNREHRKLAGKLIDEVGPTGQTVVFLESYSGGPPIHDEDPSMTPPSGLAIFNIYPANWILLHLAVAGIILCFSSFPIFGRPRSPRPDGTSDFGRHVGALGELLQRSRDTAYARAKLKQYHQSTRSDAGGKSETNPKSEGPGR